MHEILFAESGVPWSTILDNKLLLSVAAAILGFVASYVLELVKARRAPRYAMTWDYEVASPRVTDTDGSAGDLKITYDGESVEQLCIVQLQVANSGTLLIKNQYLRFRFPGKARLLEAFLPPDTELEREVTKQDVKGSASEARYRIGHFPPAETVRFNFVCDGGDWSTWTTVYPKNDDTHVSFKRKGVAKAEDDRHRLARFLRNATAFAACVILAFMPVMTESKAISLAMFCLGALILGLMFLDLRSAANTVASVIANRLNRSPIPTTAITAYGSTVTSTATGNVSLTPREPSHDAATPHRVNMDNTTG